MFQYVSKVGVGQPTRPQPTSLHEWHDRARSVPTLQPEGLERLYIFLVFWEICLNTAFSMHPNNEELQLAAATATCLAVWFDRTERYGRYLADIRNVEEPSYSGRYVYQLAHV